ncbi:hypothetical protein CTAYLR_001268 [Chrysophaeum taylorii]|uniref:Sulfotransferase n=1 Tax=Chrysophaeum taylorii TaxID=2483200 RepID=A0AAD7UCR5_9STRA|nr:hypothetical protein CTAYLR_001268 [Chrysophaeum taylorii]
MSYNEPKTRRMRLQRLATLVCFVASGEGHWAGFDCSEPRDGSDNLTIGQRECSCGGTKRDTRPVRWIHVPKTGTQFGNTVFRAACDTLPPYAAMRAVPGESLRHAPHKRVIPYFLDCFPNAVERCLLDGGIALAQGHHALESFAPQRVAYVTMLRDPFSRLVSSFHDDYHDCKKCRGTSLVEFARSSQTAAIYANFLLGRSSEELNASSAVAEATERLKKFAFVGIVERWARAVCLYHSIFGGIPTNAEFMNTVRKSMKHNETSLADLSAELRRDARYRHRRRSDPHDLSLVDDYIYQAAVVRFDADFRAYEARCKVPKYNK